MSTQTATEKRHVMEVVGQILPDALYTREGVMRFGGIGLNNLIEARRSGIVKPIECGKRIYYRGSELIAWIESKAKAKRRGTR